MTLLVLCIDRDNDLGVKAGVASPLVGRAANVEGATRLSLADPEDSDANSVFGAVHIHDELVAAGQEAEVVTLCGHPRVGPVSDRIIATQLDTVLAARKYEACIFVTDGAEDEFLLPVVASRIPIESVRRIIVKQHADMESTYYVIKKALEDEKLQRSLVLPFALACLVFGVFAVMGQLVMGIGAIFITVGLFGIGKILRLDRAAKASWNYLYVGLTKGHMAFYTAIAGLFVGAIGLVAAGRPLLLERETVPATLLALGFLRDFVWWAVIAILVGASGKVLDAYLREGVILWRYWMLPFSLVSLGFLTMGATNVLATLVTESAFEPSVEDWLLMGTGVLLLAIGYVSAAVVRQRASRLERPAAAIALEEPGAPP
ncbi:MAG TPA: DUF373 family protein [Candidatus Thermoplasmatota archaeon]|nr:DUF373 family protein [Candidatus Thermoplasmatota archaeon]